MLLAPWAFYGASVALAAIADSVIGATISGCFVLAGVGLQFLFASRAKTRARRTHLTAQEAKARAGDARARADMADQRADQAEERAARAEHEHELASARIAELEAIVERRRGGRRESDRE